VALEIQFFQHLCVRFPTSQSQSYIKSSQKESFEAST